MTTKGESCPALLIESMMRYAKEHIPCGSFLRAVLAGDLFEAAFFADAANHFLIAEIAMWAFLNLPPESIGSWAAVERWETTGSTDFQRRIPYEVGLVVGAAMRIKVAAAEAFLAETPKHFLYADQVKAVIRFRREIDGSVKHE